MKLNEISKIRYEDNILKQLEILQNLSISYANIGDDKKYLELNE